MAILFQKGDLAQYKIEHYLKYLKINKPEEFERFFFKKQPENPIPNYGTNDAFLKILMTDQWYENYYQVSDSLKVRTSFGFEGCIYGYQTVYQDSESLRVVLEKPSFVAWHALSPTVFKNVKKPTVTILSERYSYPKNKLFSKFSFGFYLCLVSLPDSKESHKLYISELWLDAHNPKEYWQELCDELDENATKNFARNYIKKLTSKI